MAISVNVSDKILNRITTARDAFYVIPHQYPRVELKTWEKVRNWVLYCFSFSWSHRYVNQQFKNSLKVGDTETASTYIRWGAETSIQASDLSVNLTEEKQNSLVFLFCQALKKDQNYITPECNHWLDEVGTAIIHEIGGNHDADSQFPDTQPILREGRVDQYLQVIARVARIFPGYIDAVWSTLFQREPWGLVEKILSKSPDYS